MIAIGQLVRVMNVVKTDSVLVGTVRVLDTDLLTGITLVKVQPTFGDAKWVDAQDCQVLQESDL